MGLVPVKMDILMKVLLIVVVKIHYYIIIVLNINNKNFSFQNAMIDVVPVVVIIRIAEFVNTQT